MGEPIYLPDLGTILIERPPVIVESTPWLHTFRIAIPCLDISTADMLEKVVSSSASHGYDLIKDWNDTITTYRKSNNDTPVTSISLSLIESLRTNIDVTTRRSAELKTMVTDLASNGYKLYGLLNNTMCITPHMGHSYSRVPRDTHVHFHENSHAGIKVTAHHGGNRDEDIDSNTDSKVSATTSSHVKTNSSPQNKGTYSNADQRQPMNNHMMPRTNTYTRTIEELPPQQSDPAANTLQAFKSMFPSTQPTQTSSGWAMDTWECLTLSGQEIRCKKTATKPMSTDQTRAYLASRSKRGLLDPVGKAYKWMFGTMDSEDRAMITAALDNLQKQTTATRDYVVSSEKKFLSFATEVDETINRHHLAIQKKFGVISDNIEKLNLFRTKITSTLAQNIQLTHLTGEVTALSMFIMNILDSLNTCVRNIHEVQTYLSAVYHSMVTGVPSTKLVTSGMILQMLSSIMKSVGDKYTLPDSRGFYEWYKTSIMSPAIVDDTLSIAISSPLIPRDNMNISYLIRSLPFKSKDTWFEFPYDRFLLQHNPAKSKWTLVDPLDARLCSEQPFQLCPPHISVYIQDPTMCLSHLIGGSSVYPDSCQLRHNKGIIPIVPLSVRVDATTWLVSNPDTDRMATLECPFSGGITDRSARSVGGLALIKVPRLCKMLLGPLLLDASGTREIITNSSMLLNTTYEDLHLKNMSWVVSDHKSYISHLLETVIQTQLRDPKEVAFPKSVIKIKDLKNKIAADRGTYMDTMAVLSDQVGTIQKKLSIDPGWSDLMDTFRPDLTSVIALILSGLSLVFTMLVYIRTRSGITPMVALASKTPGSWAMVIRKASLNASNVTQELQRWSDLQILKDRVLAGPIVGLLGIVLMVSLMIGCHCLTKKHISARFEKIASLMGLIWKNKSAQHNPGECKFITYFLVNITSKYPTRSVTVEVPVQICTIPLGIDDWYLREPVRHDRWINSRDCLIIGRKLTFDLNWSPDTVCVKSKLSKDLETCNEMPKIVTLPLWYVAQDANLPWWAVGIRYSVISVSRILLEKHGGINDLYHYKV